MNSQTMGPFSSQIPLQLIQLPFAPSYRWRTLPSFQLERRRHLSIDSFFLTSLSQSRERTNNGSCYKQITLQILFSVHIDEYLLRVHLLRRQLSAVRTANLTLKGVLTVDTLATLRSVHGLGSIFVQRRKLSLLTNEVDNLHHRLRGQILLLITAPQKENT